MRTAQNLGPGKLRPTRKGFGSSTGGMFGLSVFGSGGSFGQLAPLQKSVAGGIIRRAGPGKLRLGPKGYTTQPTIGGLTGVSVFGSVSLASLSQGSAQPFEAHVGPAIKGPFHPSQFTGKRPAFTVPLALIFGESTFSSVPYGPLTGVGGITGLSTFASVPLGPATALAAGSMSGTSVSSSVANGQLTAQIAFTGLSVFAGAAYGAASGAAAASGVAASAGAFYSRVMGTASLSGVAASMSVSFGLAIQSASGAISGVALVFGSIAFAPLTAAGPLQGVSVSSSAAFAPGTGALTLTGVSTFESVLWAPGQTATAISGIAVFSSAWFASLSSSSVHFGFARVTVESQSGLPVHKVVIIELSACFVTAAYFDPFGNPFIPSAVSYRVDDVTSGAEILGWTALTPGTSNQVTVSSAQNAMISLTRDYETHQVLFQITDGFGDITYAKGRYFVARVTGLN